MPLSIREIAAFASLGILEPGIAYLLGLIGLVHVDAIDAVIIQASESMMIVLLSIVIYGQIRPCLYRSMPANCRIGFCPCAIAYGV